MHTEEIKQMKTKLEEIHEEFTGHTINGDWLGEYSGTALDAMSDLLYWSEKLDESSEPL